MNAEVDSKQKLKRRIKDERNRARGEEGRSFDRAVLGTERAPAELAVIIDCFAKLDRTIIGGSLARWVSTQKAFSMETLRFPSNT
jgi:hypothetical protein